MKLTQNESDLMSITQLIEYAFNKTQPIQADPLFLSRFNHASCYGHTTNGQLTSVVMANHFTAQLYHKQLALAGIGYVASYPEARGTGGVATVMNELLTDLSAKEIPLSLLAPFSEGFYRQFGYENVIYQKQYQLTKQAFNFFKSEPTGAVKRGNWQNEALKEQVIAFYQRQLAKGCEVATITRENWWWDRLDQYYAHRFNAVCFDEEDQVCGYIIYRMVKDTFIVDELSYCNLFGLRKLLTFIKSHVSSFEKFTYAAPVTECLEDCFSEQDGIAITLKPYMMGRVIDFAKVVESLPLKQAGTYYFEVTQDSQCPQNQGVWQVVVDEKVTCCKVKQAQSDLSGTITSFTQLFLGGKSLNQLLFLEKLTCEEPKKLARLFPKGQHTFYDYF